MRWFSKMKTTNNRAKLAIISQEGEEVFLGCIQYEEERKNHSLTEKDGYKEKDNKEIKLVGAKEEVIETRPELP